MKISVLIPMYNEEKCAGTTARELVAALSGLSDKTGYEYEIIFSDDGSADRSRAIIEELIAGGDCPGVRLVVSDVNCGKGAAVRRAALCSLGDAVIFTDCDLAYGTDVIGEAVKALGDVDVVIGSRAIHPEGYEGYTPLRKAASKIYMKILARSAGFSLSDCQCGFKAFRGDICRELFRKCETDGWSFDFEILMRAQKKGVRIREMPVKVIRHGGSKIRLVRDSVKMLSDVRRLKKKMKNQA